MTIQEIKLPDIGNFAAVEVIEVLVKAGDVIAKEGTLLVLETDKATLEIPSPVAGTIKEVKVVVGDKIAKGSSIAVIILNELSVDSIKNIDNEKVQNQTQDKIQENSTSITKVIEESKNQSRIDHNNYSGPATRKLAREFGVELALVQGSGRGGRVTTQDLILYIKNQLTLAPVVKDYNVGYDFAEFGEIEVKQLSRIKLKTAENLHRNWITIPHVTQFDEADFTAVEEFRSEFNKKITSNMMPKLTPLVFLMRAVALALFEFPQFGGSLSLDGKNLIIKKYCHLGVAVDTDNGLLVPVIKDVDKKSIIDLAIELKNSSAAARDGKISGKDLQGSCFTISSLGGLGGTAFTPIINAPNVAILGVSKASIKPVYSITSGAFVPRLILPLSLSYDHRVIDGAEAVRFIRFLADTIENVHKGLNEYGK